VEDGVRARALVGSHRRMNHMPTKIQPTRTRKSMSQHHWPPTLRDMVVIRRIVPLIAVEVEAKMSF
jgi:hypothetical protein